MSSNVKPVKVKPETTALVPADHLVSVLRRLSSQGQHGAAGTGLAHPGDGTATTTAALLSEFLKPLFAEV